MRTLAGSHVINPDRRQLLSSGATSGARGPSPPHRRHAMARQGTDQSQGETGCRNASGIGAAATTGVMRAGGSKHAAHSLDGPTYAHEILSTIELIAAL